MQIRTKDVRREIQSYTSVAPYPLILVVADIPTTTTGNPGNKKKSDHAPKFSDYLTFAFCPFFNDKSYSSVEVYRLIFGLVIFLKVPYADLIID